MDVFVTRNTMEHTKKRLQVMTLTKLCHYEENME